MSVIFDQAGWLWLLVPMAGWLALLERRTRRGSAWRDIVDPALLPHLLVPPANRHRRHLPLALAATALVCAALSLAGPVVTWHGQTVELTTGLLFATAVTGAAAFRRGWMG